jgi:hypothetical protein
MMSVCRSLSTGNVCHDNVTPVCHADRAGQHQPSRRAKKPATRDKDKANKLSQSTPTQQEQRVSPVSSVADPRAAMASTSACPGAMVAIAGAG